MTATVETVSDPLDLDLATMLPSEKIVTAVARSVTLSDADVAQATVQIAKPSIVGAEQDSAENVNLSSDDSSDGDFWHTSVGKFKFCIEQLPQTLQFIHQLLIELPSIDKPEILYECELKAFMLCSLTNFYKYFTSNEMLKYIGSSWRCIYKSSKRSSWFLHLVPRKLIDQKVI